MVIQHQFLFPWIYLTVLLLNLILFSFPYIYSLMPAKLAKKRGDAVWKLCKRLRTIGTAFMFIALIGMVLWIWFPISVLIWPINPNPWVGIFVFIYVPLVMHYEEKDLAKRFSDEYIEFKEHTRTLFPKMRKRTKSA